MGDVDRDRGTGGKECEGGRTIILVLPREAARVFSRLWKTKGLIESKNESFKQLLKKETCLRQEKVFFLTPYIK